MTQYGNAAQRLAELLTRGRDIPGQVSARHAWEQLLGIKEQQTSDLLARLSPVFALPQKVRREASEAGLHNEYLAKFEQIEDAFATTHLDSQWAHFNKTFSDESLSILRLCGRRLSEQRDHSPDVADNALEELLKQLRALADEVRKAQISDDLKRFLFEQLRRAQRAIEDYTILGPDAFKEVFLQAVGEVVTRPELQEEQKKTPIAKKFWTFMHHTALTLQVGRTVLELPSVVSDLSQLGS